MGIVAATDYERLYLGYGEEDSASYCLGTSIMSYHEPFAQFMTKLFRYSIDIEVDGKKWCVNTKSLKKHLCSIGFEDSSLEDVKKLGYQTLIQKNREGLIVSHNRLGENFSHSLRMALFTKMLDELEANNTQSVKKLIRQGAYFDREFFKLHDSIQRRSLWDNRSELENSLCRFYATTHFFSYTPLAFAAEKGNQTLAKFLLNMKNNDHSSDKKETVLYTVGHQNSCSATRYWTTQTIKVERVSIQESNGSVGLV